eukprot:TRINITY_DN4151_c0_g2_i5.p1 TRINITY_DN4151_c0_g2~~TRINITY_DN4151_c0_g2_i5.p1  ORF type:complete len:526 (-),score=59.58 TRINITY_DN4151_c0_g2_i5:209-1786(-)
MPCLRGIIDDSVLLRRTFVDKASVVQVDGDTFMNIDQPIHLTSLSTAPLGDSSEDEAPNVAHTVDGSSRSFIGSTTEPSNPGSAQHHAGLCTPCRFKKTKTGCNIGSRCNFCHFPHEEITANQMRKARLARVRVQEKIDRLTAWKVEASLVNAAEMSAGSELHEFGVCRPCVFVRSKKPCFQGLACKDCHFPHEEVTRSCRRRARKERERLEQTIDTMAWLAPLPQTRGCSEEASVVHNDGDVVSSIDQPIQLATSSEASFAGSSEGYARKDLHNVNDSPYPIIRSTTAKSREDSGKKSEESERAIVGSGDACLPDTMAWLAPSPRTRSTSEEDSTMHIDGVVVSNIDQPIQLVTSPEASFAGSSVDHARNYSHTVNDSQCSLNGSTAELLSVGSARTLKEFGRAIVGHGDACISNSMAWLAPRPQTRACSEEASAMHIDGDAVSNIAEPIQLTSFPEASFAGRNEDDAANDMHIVDDSSMCLIGSTTELLSVCSELHHVGTCIRCRSMNTKLGSDTGSAVISYQ